MMAITITFPPHPFHSFKSLVLIGTLPTHSALKARGMVFEYMYSTNLVPAHYHLPPAPNKTSALSVTSR